MSLRDQVKIGISERNDFPLQPGKAALLIIDIQKYLTPNKAKKATKQQRKPKASKRKRRANNNYDDDEDDSFDYDNDDEHYDDDDDEVIKDIRFGNKNNRDNDSSNDNHYLSNVATPRTLHNLKKLTQHFRRIRDRSVSSNTDNSNRYYYEKVGCEVIFIYLQCLTNDGRDMSLDYKLSGPLLANIPRVGCPLEDIFLAECYPDIIKAKQPSIPSVLGTTTPTITATAATNGRSNDTTKCNNSRGDILIPKTSCSVFRSTNIDYVLRNLGIEQLVITGQLTNQCIESAVRDAADSGYFITVVQDACSANSIEDHERGLYNIRNFARIVDTPQILLELRKMEHKIKTHEKIRQCKSKVPLAAAAMDDRQHELIALPKQTKFSGYEIVPTGGAYVQFKCTGCKRRVRTYCMCSPGTIRCNECYAKHLVDTEMNDNNDIVTAEEDDFLSFV